MKTRSYVVLVLVVAAVAPVSTALFNLAVDPYDFRGMLGLTRVDPARISLYGEEGPFSGEWFGKTYNVRWFRPTAAVFGSSSAGGLLDLHEVRDDPRVGLGKRVFHFTVAGPSIGMLKHYFLHTQALSRLDHAVLELHFFMFNVDRYSPDQAQLARVPFAHLPGYGWRFLRSMFEMSVVAQTTRDSWDTLLLRYFPGTTLSKLEGQLANWNGPPPAAAVQAAAPPGLVMPDDYRRQILTVDRAIYIGLYHHRPAATFRFENETGYDAFDELREILAGARRRKTRLRAYLAPSHARMYEMIAHDGRWPMFEEWKRRVARIFAEDAAAHPDDPIVLWDFSGYNSVTTDEFPARPAPTLAFEYFLDTVHYNSTAQDLVVDRIFDYDGGRAIPDDFGVALTPSNVERVIERTRLAKARYEEAHAAELAELRAVLATVR